MLVKHSIAIIRRVPQTDFAEIIPYEELWSIVIEALRARGSQHYCFEREITERVVQRERIVDYHTSQASILQECA
jgi:hypothetical protein